MVYKAIVHLGLLYIFLMIYKRIRDLREDNDLKQRTLAEYLSISQRAYSRYETGERAIPVEALSKLADYYGVSVDYLIGRTDKK